jgi:TatD DNase family protein
MIDTHCHLDSPRFDADRAEVLARARAAGVEVMVLPAVEPSRWEDVRRLAASDPGLRFGLGIHPQALPDLDPADDDRHLADLDAALARGGAVAIGECGLDGPTADAGASMDRQRAILRAHLALARRHRLPVLLHCLRAHDHLLALLEEEPLPAGGVLHSFSGSAEQVRTYLPSGLCFSFAGPVTYPGARKPLAALRAVPRERLLIETDAPDQAPTPHRGARNEPAHLVQVAAACATALSLSVEALDALTSLNARRLLGG